MAEYISKQDVIDYLNGYLNSIGECGADSLLFDRGQRRALINSIQDILAAKAADVHPVKQWVKLHDKRPDTEGFYLVCDQYGECEVAEYIPDIKSWFTHKINGEIQYWIPLPELPKDGDT